MASVEECAAATQERAGRIVELADMRARQAASRAAKDRKNRAKVTQDVRDRIRRREEDSVTELIADYDTKLAHARQQMRGAQSEARNNTTAAATLAATRRVVRARDERIRELEHELELEQRCGVEGRAALEKLAGVPDLSPTKERGRPLPSAMRKVCLHMLACRTARMGFSNEAVPAHILASGGGGERSSAKCGETVEYSRSEPQRLPHDPGSESHADHTRARWGSLNRSQKH